MEAVLPNGVSELIASQSPLSLLCLVRMNKEKILFSSSESQLFIHTFGPSSHLSKLVLSTSEEVSCSKKPIVDIVQHDQRFYVLNNGGIIYSLGNNKFSDGYFEYSISDLFVYEEYGEGWQYHEYACIQCDQAFSMCSSKMGLCVLGFHNNMLSLHVLEEKGNIFTVELCNNTATKGLLAVISSSSVCDNFRVHWRLPKEPCEQYIFVTVDGSLYCWPVLRNVKPKLLYKSVHLIISIHWYSDVNSESFNSLTMMLQNGCMIRLHPFGEDVKFPFSTFASVGYLSHSYSISYNGFEIIVYPKKVDKNSAKTEELDHMTIPLSGVISITNSSKENEILVSTNSSKVLIIDLDIVRNTKRTMNTDISDKLTDLNNVIIQTKYLSELNEKIKKEDEALRTTSLAARSDILSQHFLFTAKAIQGLGNKYSFRVKIVFDVSGVIFSKDSWALSLTLSSVNNKVVHEEFHLRENISCEKDYIRLLTLPVEFDFLYLMSCELLMHSDLKNHSLKIPIGKLEVDCSYFLIPLSLGDLFEEDCDVWSCTGLHSLGLSLVSEPTSPLKTLLMNSKALWRTSEWAINTEGKEATFLVFGSKVLVRLDDNVLNITSTSLKACFAVKIAAALQLLKQRKDLRSQLLLELTGWYQAGNILQYNLDKKWLLLEMNRLLDSSKYSAT